MPRDRGTVNYRRFSGKIFDMKLFQSRAAQEAATLLYEAIVAQARRPEFYRSLGVADTIDGRFEMIALHAFIVLHQLRADGAGGARTSQALFDRMFSDFDRSLREMGAGDLGVGRRVKTLAKQFYGRLAAYGRGLEGSDADLSDALARNMYGGAPSNREHVAAMATYLRREASSIAAQDAAERRRGAVRFGAPPKLEAVS